MNRLFRHDHYRQGNPDLEERFDPEDETGLFEHFKRFGRREMRGMQPEEHVRVEGALFSDKGHVFVVGWADRRMFVDFRLTIDIGYLRFEFDADDLLWYRREDVSAMTGDSESLPGFIGLLTLDIDDVHGHVVISASGIPCYEERKTRFLSKETFLDEALAATAVLADRPAGQTTQLAPRMLPIFRDLWLEVNEARHYIEAFSCGETRDVTTSIVIVLHRDARMLLMQLTLLAEFLETSPSEVIIVGNVLSQPDQLVQELIAFTQIHDISLRLFLCSGNAGFSAANNYGARMARGDHLVFMNPDIFPPEGQRDQAYQFLSTDPGEGLVGALLYYGDGLLMHSGMYVAADKLFDTSTGSLTKLLRVEHFGKGLMHHVTDPLPEAVLQASQNNAMLVTAALWKIRKSVFTDLGGLPEDYIFAYYEDADFAMKLRESDIPLSLDTDARFIHLEGVGGAKSPKMRTAMWLNRCTFTDRYSQSPYVVADSVDRMEL